MNPSPRIVADGGHDAEQVLWKDAERVVYRTTRAADGVRSPVLAVVAAAEPAYPDRPNRLTHEYGLRDDLEEAWAARPLELLQERGQSVLLLRDPGGEPLDRLIGPAMEIGSFLRLAIALAAALGSLHERGLVHKDIKPGNVLVDAAAERAWLTGFGIASRQREHQLPGPPEFIAGTLAYMAPEQTGCMNRSIDARSDLYSLGITFYQMLTGSLPFTASDPTGWIHCHVARMPVAPKGRLESIPAPVSAIVMKLLAKVAEDRYQTAAGLMRDLQQCRVDWETRGRIDAFPLGGHDASERLSIPEKLYGRAVEIERLIASYRRVAETGGLELVLVSGYAGIGKSSVVNELHRVLVPLGGLFAAGKFDQHKRDIPYDTLAQAFQTLVRALLSKNDSELSVWREAFRQALGSNGQLIVDLVPELKLIIGEQPPVPTLALQDTQRRFQLVFRRFIGVFARPEHPLALFLDDLQWLDAATLDVLEDLLTQSDTGHLLLIGAYRDSEVGSGHPLMRRLEAVRKTGATLCEIVLRPLALEDLGQLLADSLHCQRRQVGSLARLLHQKAAGNPFFTSQLLSSLAEEGLLAFDRRRARWSWDLGRIHAKGYTDNVVDLMAAKVSRLPPDTRKAMQQLACLGNSADVALLAMLGEHSENETHRHLRAAVRAGLVLRSGAVYRFLHDRVQEAAYSLIPEPSRARVHLRIGRLLAASIAPDKRDEAIFEIVHQLNRGSNLITSHKERKRVAELNFMSAARAKSSTAYTSALSYLGAAQALLTRARWETDYELLFSLERETAECELLSADMASAENRLTLLAARAERGHDVAVVARLRLMLYTALDQSDRAVDVCLEYLRRTGTTWSAHPTADEAQREYDQIWSRLGGRPIEDLIDLPLVSDRDVLDALEVLADVVSAALFTDENLSSLGICRMVNLSLEHGNGDASCFAYVWFAIIAGPRFGNYRDGFRFGRLGYELVEQRGLKRFQARTYMSFGDIVLPWTKHVRTGRDLLRRAFEAASEAGDMTYAAFCCDHLVKNQLAAGDRLLEAQREAENGLQYAQKVGFRLVADHLKVQLGLVRSLRGLTFEFGSFDDTEFDEPRFERHLRSNPALAELECWYWVRKLQARYFAGEFASAIEAASNAQRHLWTSPSQFETAELSLYAALAHAASYGSAPPEKQKDHFGALVACHRQLESWATHCPENFENRAALVGAEIARIEGRELDAERLYERAIRSARANGFVHNEAVASERAAHFHGARGFETISEAYLKQARDCYVRWGADGKVRQLDQAHTRLKDLPVAGPTGTISAAVEHLDLATAINVSQAVSGEIVLEKLVDILMRTALGHAGAQRGLLVLSRGMEPRIEAEATTSGDAAFVHVRSRPLTAELLPEKVLNYALRTKNSIILDDAAVRPEFLDDPYIRSRQARSILCLPLITQGNLIGALYLENNLARGAFARGRLPILELLASQTATALENAHLYRDLAQREARIRRLIDAGIIGICIWDRDGRIVEANEAFLRLVGYDHEYFVGGDVCWTDMAPADWHDLGEGAACGDATVGLLPPAEKQLRHKDGSRVPVLIGAANFEEGGNECVAFVLDLTERKRAEAAAHKIEQRLHEVQTELAHANRASTLGQLSASIAHEINQPITATITFADAALRWLRARPPNLAEVEKALTRISEGGVRAGEVIDRVRALVKKVPTRKDRLEINGVVLEVMDLICREAEKNGISVQTRLADSLPLIPGDRVQLQQVVLNLVINAVEAMGDTREGPRNLLVATAGTDAGVLVTVQDSGPGLPPESVEQMFEAFYTTKPGGLGMGLSICRAIIEAHNGRLWGTGNRPHGAIFSFTLPTSRTLSN